MKLSERLPVILIPQSFLLIEVIFQSLPTILQFIIMVFHHSADNVLHKIWILFTIAYLS
jgi:hypothetical protein